MGEFSPPSNIEIIFDFSDIITEIHPPISKSWIRACNEERYTCIEDSTLARVHIPYLQATMYYFVYNINVLVMLFDDFPKISDRFPKISKESLKIVRRPHEHFRR